MTTYAAAEAARLRAIDALDTAGLTAEADRLAALPPITDRETTKAASVIARSALAASDAGRDRAVRAAYASIGASRAADEASYQTTGLLGHVTVAKELDRMTLPNCTSPAAHADGRHDLACYIGAAPGLAEEPDPTEARIAELEAEIARLRGERVHYIVGCGCPDRGRCVPHGWAGIGAEDWHLCADHDHVVDDEGDKR